MRARQSEDPGSGLSRKRQSAATIPAKIDRTPRRAARASAFNLDSELSEGEPEAAQ
jgi:hypothetical protein